MCMDGKRANDSLDTRSPLCQQDTRRERAVAPSKLNTPETGEEDILHRQLWVEGCCRGFVCIAMSSSIKASNMLPFVPLTETAQL